MLIHNFKPRETAMKTKTVLPVLCLLLSGFTFPTPVIARDLRAEEFQILPRDRDFEALRLRLNLEDPAYALEFKSTGTSLGLKIKDAQKKSVGKFLPTNGAANIEAQIVSHRLGQFLHMSHMVVPSGPYTLGPRATGIFYDMVSSAQETNQWRRENQEELLEALQRNSQSLSGVLTPKTEEWEVEELVSASQNTINRTHPLAQMVQANGPKPSATQLMSLKGVRAKDGRIPTETQLELSRQLSQIMVLDILCGQWDRWSGGNLEASINSSGRLYLIARDNGGASMKGTNWINPYLRIVSRFDRNQIQRVQRLVTLLSGNERIALAAALELKSDSSALLARANALLAHVQNMSAQWGEQNVFF
jgi:hypothetical protein